MADNLTLPAVGTSVSTDDLGGGLHVQRVKTQFGVDGSSADVTNANPLPVKVTDGTTATTVKAGSTAPVSGDTALVTVVSPNQTTLPFSLTPVSATGAIAALNANVAVALNGNSRVGVKLPSNNLAGTLVAEVSFDSGSTWEATNFYGENGSAYYASLVNPTAAATYSIQLRDGVTNARVKISAYTSGSVTPVVSATNAAGRTRADTTLDPAGQIWKSFAYTSAQTGTTVWQPASGKKIVVTHYNLGAGGTTAGKITLWFGASGDTTYSEGTDQPVCKFYFTPTVNATPGAVISLPQPIVSATVDYYLKLTTSAGITIDGVVYGYEI